MVWGAGLAVSAAWSVAACGDDVTCGAGTVRSGSECVAAGGAPESGGSSSGGAVPGTSGGASSGGTGTGGSGGTSPASGGGESDGSAGGSSGGATNEDSGAGATGGGPSTGGAGNGGANAGGTGTGGAGTGGSGPDVQKEPRWAALLTDVAYVYDLTKAGEPAAFVRIGTSFPAEVYVTSPFPRPLPEPSPWSSDGRRILVFEGPNLTVRDMSGDTPGAPLILGALPVSVYWSPDSKSLAVYDNGSLSAVDPTQATPIRKPIATNVRFLEWAPKGDLLYYTTNLGHYVVKVVAGVPATPQNFPAVEEPIFELPVKWLPDGTRLLVRDGVVKLIDFNGSAYQTFPLAGSDPLSARPNFDGTLIAFQVQATRRAHYVTVGAGGVGAPTPVGGDSVSPSLWAGAANVLVTWSESGSYANVFGANGAGERIPLPSQYVSAVSPDGRRILHPKAEVRGLASWDRQAPSQPSLELLAADVDAPAGIQFANDGVRIAYRLGGQLRVQDVVTGEYSETAANNAPTWSPGNSFIVFRRFVAGGSARNPFMLRVEGTNLSAPIPLGTGSVESGRLTFQPVVPR